MPLQAGPSRVPGASRLCTALRLPGDPAAGWGGVGLPQGQPAWSPVPVRAAVWARGSHSPPGLGPWTRLVGGRHLLGPVLSGGRGTVRSVNPKGRRRDGDIHASVTATARRVARTANSRPPASSRLSPAPPALRGAQGGRVSGLGSTSGVSARPARVMTHPRAGA